MVTKSLKHLTGNGTPSVHPPDPHKQQKRLVQAESQQPEDGACLGELDIQTALAIQAFLIETRSLGTLRFLGVLGRCLQPLVS